MEKNYKEFWDSICLYPEENIEKLKELKKDYFTKKYRANSIWKRRFALKYSILNREYKQEKTEYLNSVFSECNEMRNKIKDLKHQLRYTKKYDTEAIIKMKNEIEFLSGELLDRETHKTARMEEIAIEIKSMFEYMKPYRSEENEAKKEYDMYFATFKSYIMHEVRFYYGYKNWKTFSLGNRPEDEIRKRLLIRNKYCNDSIGKNIDLDFVCVSYICERSELTEEFLKELMFITSNLFDYEYYDQFHIDLYYKINTLYASTKKQWIKNIYDSGILKDVNINPKFLEKFNSNATKASACITDRIDWYGISINKKTMKNLSPEFIDDMKSLIGDAKQSVEALYTNVLDA